MSIKGPTVTMRLYYRERVDGVFKREFSFGLVSRGSTVVEAVETFPIAIAGPADLYVTAETDSSGMSISARLQFLLEKI